MSDILVRGVDADLKRRIEEGARRHRRTLSEEAIALMRKALSSQAPNQKKAGDHLRALIDDCFFTEDEISAIERSRKESDRSAPTLT